MPAERLGYMLEDSDLRVVVTQTECSAYMRDLPAFAGLAISLEDTGWQQNRRDNLVATVGPEHIAYVILHLGLDREE